MPSYTIYAKTAKTLLDFHGLVELCDEAGNVIGTFQPRYNREAPRSIAEIEEMRNPIDLAIAKLRKRFSKSGACNYFC